jgi:hypothetical protein
MISIGLYLVSFIIFSVCRLTHMTAGLITPLKLTGTSFRFNKVNLNKRILRNASSTLFKMCKMCRENNTVQIFLTSVVVFML